MSQLILSVSNKPGKFGETVHNIGFARLGLDYKYVAIHPIDMEGTIRGMLDLKLHGCSVSSPYKQDAFKLIDLPDHVAVATRSVNTIVNDKQTLRGFNTDVAGAHKFLEELNLPHESIVTILGAGGAAMSVAHALRLLGIRSITFYDRSYTYLNSPPGHNMWESREDMNSGDLLINATPNGRPFDPGHYRKICRKFNKFWDLNPERTEFVDAMRRYGKPAHTGRKMRVYQALEQFYLYTGQKPPTEMVEAAWNYST